VLERLLDSMGLPEEDRRYVRILFALERLRNFSIREGDLFLPLDFALKVGRFDGLRPRADRPTDFVFRGSPLVLSGERADELDRRLVQIAKYLEVEFGVPSSPVPGSYLLTLTRA
jgi:hypothetical protein